MSALLKSIQLNLYIYDDEDDDDAAAGNTGIFHVFELRIEMNEFDHRSFFISPLKQQRERPEKFGPERGFEP